MPLSYESPPPSLLLELEEVSAASRALNTSIGDSNNLPSDFPRDSVTEICNSLRELHAGSAEGCRVPLEYARSRLPAIRRKYIQIESLEVDPLSEEPSLTRGMTIDRGVQYLLASVTTALDEYRRLAAEAVDDPILIEVDKPSDPEAHAPVIATSQTVETQFEDARLNMQEVWSETSLKADSLNRSIIDAENINRLGRAELTQKTIVVRWLKSLAKKMRQYPSIIRGLGNTISVTHDIAAPLIKHWEKIWADFTSLALDSYKDLADVFYNIADNLENRKKQNKSDISDPIDPDITKSFDAWAYNFINERQSGQNGVPAQLFYAEIKHITGITSSEFAYDLGYSSFKDIVNRSMLFKIEEHSSGYNVKIADGKSFKSYIENLERRCRNYVYMSARDFVDANQVLVEVPAQEIINNIPKWSFVSRSLNTYTYFRKLSLEEYVKMVDQAKFKFRNSDVICTIKFT